MDTHREQSATPAGSAPKRTWVAATSEVLATSEGLRYRRFLFSSIDRGDCHVSNGEFRFYEDGSTSWECDVSSTDSGDEWDGAFSGGQAGYDGELPTVHLFLFAVLPSFHFDIHDANTVKHWLQGFAPDSNTYASGIGPFQTFQRLGSVVFYCGC